MGDGVDKWIGDGVGRLSATYFRPLVFSISCRIFSRACLPELNSGFEAACLDLRSCAVFMRCRCPAVASFA